MKENLVHREQYKNFDIEIFQDEDPQDPRDWDNMGTMVCFHRRYALGDKSNLSIEELKELVERKDVVALPLYLYDHSGISMSTNRNYPFNCPWDSGQVGYIYVTYEDIKKNLAVERVTKKVIENVKKSLEIEVETYNDYLIGNVFGYIISRNKAMTDSCWGYLGDWDGKEYGALTAAKEIIDSYYSSNSFVQEGI